MNKKFLRSALAIAVLIATVAAFTWYFLQHPETFVALADVSPLTLAILFLLYVLFMATLVWVQRSTLLLCDIRLGRRESVLLTAYSSIINFFGPLQSGPAFRGAYLKSRHGISLKRYSLATLMYYGWYALFSGLFLLAPFAGWLVVAGCGAAIAAAPLLVNIPRFKTMDIPATRSLALATLSQVSVLALIYLVALRSFLPQVEYLQGLAYTGVANLALFVSITPGAIGFRETFLVFSQQLHGIGSAAIASASVVDRGVYIAMLLAMAAVVFGLHANKLLTTPAASAAGKKRATRGAGTAQP